MDIEAIQAGFTDKLRMVMKMDAAGDEAEKRVLTELNNIAAELRNLELKVSLSSSLSAYERRKCANAIAKITEDLANVKWVKVPRKPFSFASRKLLRKKAAKEAESVVEASFDQRYCIEKKTGATVRMAADSSGGDFIVRMLRNCTVILPFMSSTLYIDDCNNCTIFGGVVTGALHMERCSSSTVYLVCHQLRLHDSKDCTFRVVTGSSPIIERSCGIRFQRLDTSLRYYDAFPEDIERSGLEECDQAGFWSTIRDFSWLKQQKNPNYQIVHNGMTQADIAFISSSLN